MAGKDVNQAVQDLFVDAVRRSQEAIAELVRSTQAQWTSSPFLPPPGFPSVPPMITLEQVDAAFDFAERILAEQRRFTKELLSATMLAGSSDGRRSVESKRP